MLSVTATTAAADAAVPLCGLHCTACLLVTATAAAAAAALLCGLRHTASFALDSLALHTHAPAGHTQMWSEDRA